MAAEAPAVLPPELREGARASGRLNGAILALTLAYSAAYLVPPSVRGFGLQEWAAMPNRYCSKTGGSVPLNDDAGMGFGVTWGHCRAMCSRRRECKMYSFGRWEKGLDALLGKRRGQMRCQLYASCILRRRRGMTVYVKPATPRHPWPALTFVAPVAANALVLSSNRFAKVSFLAMLALVALAGVACRGLAHRPPAELLLGVFAFNALVLLAVHRQVAQRRALLRQVERRVVEAAKCRPVPSPVALPQGAKILMDLTEMRGGLQPGTATGKPAEGSDEEEQVGTATGGKPAEGSDEEEQVDLTDLRQ